MKNDYNKELAILVIVIVLLAVSVFGVYYQYTNFSESRESLEEGKARLSALESHLSFLEDLKEQQEEIEAQLELFREFIPDSPRKNELVDTLYDSAPADGELTAIRIESVVENNNVSQVSFSMTYEGRYGEVVELINDLNEDNRIFRIYDIVIYEGEEGFPVINAEIAAESFFSDS